MGFYLSCKTKFVEGALRGALYDLVMGKVYSINEDAVEIIKKVATSRNDFNETEREYLQKLIKLGLVSTQKVDDDFKYTDADRLVYVWLELTDKCNLRCVHCYGEFGQTVLGIDSLLSIDNTLNLNDWKDVVDKLKSLGAESVQIIGGEPLIFPGFCELLRHIRATGIARIDVFSNLTCLDEEKLAAIKETMASVRFSIYGHDGPTHDAITRKKGSFSTLMKAVKTLVREKVPLRPAVIIMKENQHAAEQIKQLLTENGVAYGGYDTIRQNVPGAASPHFITDAQLLVPRYNTRPQFAIKEQDFYRNRFRNSCWDGKFAITAAGEVLPCIFGRSFVCGNVKTDAVGTIRANLWKYWKTPKDAITSCKDCEYRYACHDCRPVAFGMEGEYFAKHLRCTYDPYAGVWGDISAACEVSE